MLIGHSYGGGKAVEMADWFDQKLKSLCPTTRTTKIHLVTIDAIRVGSVPGEAVTNGPAAKLVYHENIYQLKDQGVPPLMGQKIDSASKNIDVSEPDKLGPWMVTRGYQRSYHKAIDNYEAESEKLGIAVGKNANRLAGFR
jgi:hypothetical protein